MSGHGTQTATIGTEHNLDEEAVASAFQFVVDTANMVDGDILELRVYQKVLAGGTYRVGYKEKFSNAQALDNKIKFSVPVANDLTSENGLKFTLKQIQGTGRSYDWKVVDLGGGVVLPFRDTATVGFKFTPSGLEGGSVAPIPATTPWPLINTSGHDPGGSEVGGTTFAVTTSRGAPIGAHIYVFASSNDTIDSITDSKGNTYTEVAHIATTSDWIGELRLFKTGAIPVDLPVGETITANYTVISTSPRNIICPFALAGVDSSPVDQIATVLGPMGSGTPLSLGPSGVTAQANELVVACFQTPTRQENPPTYTAIPSPLPPISPYTAAFNVDTEDGGPLSPPPHRLTIVYHLVSAIGTQTAQVTSPGFGGGSHNGILVTLKV